MYMHIINLYAYVRVCARVCVCAQACVCVHLSYCVLNQQLSRGQEHYSLINQAPSIIFMKLLRLVFLEEHCDLL